MSAAKRTYKGKSSEIRKAQRREAFLNAGCHLFSSLGFHKTTVKQLCQEAKLTERYFYESFKKREDLFGACYELKLNRLVSDISQAVLSQQTTDIAKVAEVGLNVFFSSLNRDRDMANILLVEIYGVPYDKERIFRISVGRFSDLVEQIALRHINSELPAYDPGLLASGLVGSCIQMAQRWIMDGYQQSADTLVANCMLIFSGLSERLDRSLSEAQQSA